VGERSRPVTVDGATAESIRDAIVATLRTNIGRAPPGVKTSTPESSTTYLGRESLCPGPGNQTTSCGGCVPGWSALTWKPMTCDTADAVPAGTRL